MGAGPLLFPVSGMELDFRDDLTTLQRLIESSWNECGSQYKTKVVTERLLV